MFELNWNDFLGAKSGGGLPAAAMIARAVIVYLSLIVLMRMGKKRFLGDATVFDVVLSIVIGAISGRVVTGAAPVLASLAAIAALIALHWGFSWLGVRSPTFSALVKGSPDLIVSKGKTHRAAMRQAHMSEDDLLEDLRNQGVRHVREVEEARLERSGKMSVIKKRR